MFPRRSVTYSGLQNIMATTVKRGLMRSQLGDREHTTKINELLKHYADKASSSSEPPTTVIQSLGDLQQIIQFHAFVNAFNRIMQGPLEGKSSVIAAREVEKAINDSQQKFLADQWAPYFDLFSKKRYQDQHYRLWLEYEYYAFHLMYEYYAFHLIKLINTILAPSNNFNLNDWLNQNLIQQDDALQVMNLEFNFIPRDETDPHYQITQLIKNAAVTNPEIHHTLQLAKLYGKYVEIFKKLKNITMYRASSEIEPQIRNLIRMLYRYIAENFNAFEEEHELYDDAINHYFSTKEKLDRLTYGENTTNPVTLTPEHFNPERLRRLIELIAEPSIKTEENWKLVQKNAYYLYFSTSDFIRFIEILKENDLSFITKRILNLPLYKSQTPTAKEINEAMLKIESPSAQAPSLFGDIISKQLMIFAYSHFAIRPNLPNDEMQLKLSILNSLSKHRGIIDENKIEHLFLTHSAAQLKFLQNFNQLLDQNKITNVEAIKCIWEYTQKVRYFIELANGNRLISILIKLNQINLPVENEGQVNCLINLCGFELTTYIHHHESDFGEKLLNILDRYTNDCLAIIMNMIYHPFDERRRRTRFSNDFVIAFNDYSQFDQSLRTREILSSVLSCQSNSKLILNLVTRLLPFDTNAILDTMANDDPNQPINLILGMVSAHERLNEIFLGAVGQFNTNLMDSGIRFILPGRKSYDLFNHIITLALNLNDTPEEIQRQIFRYLNHRFFIENPFEAPEEIEIEELPINQAQNTHTKSVHKSVSESAVRLRNYFHSNNIVIITHESLDRLHQDISEALNKVDKRDKLYQILILASKTVWRIKNESYGEYVDTTSGVMTRDLLAMIYECLFIEDARTFRSSNGVSNIVEEADARNRLYQKLYEVANEYNLDEDGNTISYKSAQYTCKPGCFNKIMEAGYTVISLVEILMITKEFAINQMKRMIEREAINCINAALEQNENKGKKLVAELKNGYSIPKEYYDQILKNVTQAYSENFSCLYEKDDGSIDMIKMGREIEAGIQWVDYEVLLTDYDISSVTPSVATVGFFQPALEGDNAPSADMQSTRKPE